MPYNRIIIQEEKRMDTPEKNDVNLEDKDLNQVQGGYDLPISSTGACPRCNGHNVFPITAIKGLHIEYKCYDCNENYIVLDD